VTFSRPLRSSCSTICAAAPSSCLRACRQRRNCPGPALRLISNTRAAAPRYFTALPPAPGRGAFGRRAFGRRAHGRGRRRGDRRVGLRADRPVPRGRRSTLASMLQAAPATPSALTRSGCRPSCQRAQPSAAARLVRSPRLERGDRQRREHLDARHSPRPLDASPRAPPRVPGRVPACATVRGRQRSLTQGAGSLPQVVRPTRARRRALDELSSPREGRGGARAPAPSSPRSWTAWRTAWHRRSRKWTAPARPRTPCISFFSGRDDVDDRLSGRGRCTSTRKLAQTLSTTAR
jgi:hypothetical protein